MKIASYLFVLCLFSAGCWESPRTAQLQEESQEEAREWNAPCRDESVLLATTAGSPNSFTCPNRLHKMRVQVATAPSNEEAAAIVFCECQRTGPAARKEQP